MAGKRFCCGGGGSTTNYHFKRCENYGIHRLCVCLKRLTRRIVTHIYVCIAHFWNPPVKVFQFLSTLAAALITFPRWHTGQFVKSDGDVHEMKHVFYATSRSLYAATIQETWEPNLRGLLVGRTVRIRVWCTNDERAEYLFFRISGDAATCDDVANLCEVRGARGKQ